jgi:hypothetical protein
MAAQRLIEEPVFVDTAYWIALLSNKDEHHQKARQVNELINGAILHSSDFIFLELLSTFADKGEMLRKHVVSLFKRFSANQKYIHHKCSHQLFNQGVELYEHRTDKSFSLVDCTSFIVMKEQNISVSLTFDNHFKQEGFRTIEHLL